MTNDYSLAWITKALGLLGMRELKLSHTKKFFFLFHDGMCMYCVLCMCTVKTM